VQTNLDGLKEDGYKEDGYKVYGLIGNPLSHSFSKVFFDNKFKIEEIKAKFYNFEISILKDFINNHSKQLNGFCITMPFKQSIMPFLDEIDSSALEIGAVNVVKRIKSNNHYILKGYNTDYLGFEKSLKENIKDLKNIKALVLGSGGASKAITYALKKNNIEYLIVSRGIKDKEIINYKDINIDILRNYKLIINTTPLGMHPFIDKTPEINFDYIDKENIIFDLIYNPKETLLLNKSKRRGAKTINGYDMLCYQAIEAYRIWNQ
jgi:shikimate dehydrogenase